MNITINVTSTKQNLVEDVRKALVELKRQLPGFEQKYIKVVLQEVKNER